MRRPFFYWSGKLFESLSSTLEVKDHHLFGKRRGESIAIPACEIASVNEFAGNNPFLLVTTTDDSRYHVGALAKDYDKVSAWLKGLGDAELSRSFDFDHRLNAILYRKQFSVQSIVKSIIRLFRNKLVT